MTDVHIFNGQDEMVKWDGTSAQLEESKGIFVTRYEKKLFETSSENAWDIKALGEIINMSPDTKGGTDEKD